MRASAFVALVLAAGCGESPPSGHLVVHALAGTSAEPGATIVAHAPDGGVVELTTADATGTADIGVNDDSLVSVIFPGEITAITGTISVVTVEPPRDGSELTVHGPLHGTAPPMIVGVLQLDGPNLNSASYFNVTLGCITVLAMKLPATIDVGACNLGSDQNLDILVRGYHDVSGAPVLDGYGAGRATMTSGVATFRVPSWQTTGAPVAVTMTGVQAFLDWTLHVDGLAFLTEPMGTSPHAFTGLVVDTTTVAATLPAAHGARITLRSFAGTPTSIALTADDFLAAVDPVPMMTNAAAQWTAVANGGDALNLHATWQVGARVSAIVPPGPHRVVWDAVLPPDATRVQLPSLDGDLGDAITPTSITPDDVVLRGIDSSTLDGYAAVLGGGIHAEETTGVTGVVEIPTNGQVRVAQSMAGAP